MCAVLRLVLEAAAVRHAASSLFFLLFSSRSVCLIGMEAVVRNDQVIGFIRRADYGFFIDRPIAYGYVLLQGWRKD